MKLFIHLFYGSCGGRSKSTSVRDSCCGSHNNASYANDSALPALPYVRIHQPQSAATRKPTAGLLLAAAKRTWATLPTTIEANSDTRHLSRYPTSILTGTPAISCVTAVFAIQSASKTLVTPPNNDAMRHIHRRQRCHDSAEMKGIAVPSAASENQQASANGFRHATKGTAGARPAVPMQLQSGAWAAPLQRDWTRVAV